MSRFAIFLLVLPAVAALASCGTLSRFAPSPLAVTAQMGSETTQNRSLPARLAAPALMVKLAPGVAVASLPLPRDAELLPSNALTTTLARIGWVRVPLGRQDAKGLAERLLTTPGVEAVEPSRELHALGVLEAQSKDSSFWDDPRAPEQYALARVATAEAHRVTEGTTRTLMAIVDTGVDFQHPDLVTRDGLTTRVVKGEDFVNLDGNPMDGNGHGTHCAGIAAAAAHNGRGVVGQAPGVRLLAVRVLGDNGAGSDAAVAAGILQATDLGATVINLSLGGPEPVKVIDDAVRYAQSHGVLLVAAMGNEGKERRIWPAANEGVLAVGATTANDERGNYSNYGAWISLCAPGDNILSTLPRGAYGLKSGTSMATPCVAGVAALVREQHPNWTPAEVRAHLENTSDDLGPPGFDPFYGHGRLNAGRALGVAR